ncbi:hybrid sensor histidine kinase/response regulator [Burkholderia ubonensis]|uniref:Virulence sensor protein BvgS n=1 Tax=Burkholderia ubonensis TaxID=101571 RepID=A0A107FNM4_9BURK|nr:ATP-binding protein [Burkholderia ubonensis]KWD75980.1 hybrid sensor histidine kinase/response regulator [Burkholderia ubonensis]KWD90448.1 hybrid sensor histidine kinase/response regulator [Burkholderia ubonensis]KWD96795.1 hybrid sensor histidine kinase/response regulator [Burkholderia ubonensis]KWE00282.1 hybrid sensor histidine kinase/response regulator [Burkholderia ubonensis]
MSYSTLQSIRRYQSISVFGGGIVVTILILIACGLGMASIVYGYLEGERRNFVNGLEETLDEIQVSETSFRNGVANTQLIWRELGPAPGQVVNGFFGNGQQLAITPYPSLVVGVPGQTGQRAEVSRYLALSFLLSRICAASSINRGRALEGYHYSTRTGLFGIVPHLARDNPALATPQARARVMAALRIEFPHTQPAPPDGRPRPHWLPPYVNPVTGQTRIRIAAEARADGQPFAVLVTEYAPDYLLSWLPERAPDGVFFITTADHRLVTMDPSAVPVPGLAERLLRLDIAQTGKAAGERVFRDGFVVFRSALGSTGWTIAYALSWADIAAGIAVQAGALAAATLVAIVVMWLLLVRFYRRALMPLYARSQRVFDSESLCRNVIEMAPIGLGLISRSDGRLMLASGALTDMIARCGGAGQTLSAQVVAQYEAFLACGAPDGTMQAVLPLEGPDDAWLHLDIIARGARYQGEDVLIAAAVDVTAKRQLVQKLEEAVRAADSANAAKSSFLAAMSHEIRTPLNVILGNLELLERTALDASQHGRVQTLRTSAEGLLAIVSDILDFSKIEAGAMSVESIEFDVIAAVERTLAAFASVAKAKGLPLFAEIDASGAQRMRGDPTRLAQVIGNLLSNAIKFTSDGRITARVSAGRNGHGVAELAIEIEDTGIGIDDAQRAKLFKAFSQVDATITRRYGGSGLGLALCDRLVAAMSGSISVASTPGVGSCFTVRLPLGAEIAVDRPRDAFDGRALILVSADDAWRKFAVPHLDAWGFDVVTLRSPSGIAAGRLARAHAVVLYGDSDAWSRAELDSLRGATPIVLATPDGPLQPYVAGRTIRVSSYSLNGLRAAMRLAAAAPGVRPLLPAGAGARPGDARSARALRALVVGEASFGGSILREQLEVLGCAIGEAGRADVALDMLANASWDVLLFGTDLPDMTGIALAEAVHARALHGDMVVVASHLTPDDVRRYADAGVERILTMPVTLAHLRGVLARAARRRGMAAPGGMQDAPWVAEAPELYGR